MVAEVEEQGAERSDDFVSLLRREGLEEFAFGVEVGLTAMLVAAGIPGPDATLATLAYRLFQFWLPIPAGAIAHVVFKREFGKPADVEAA